MIGWRIICLTLFLPSRQKKNAPLATVESRRNNGCLSTYANIQRNFVRTLGKAAGSLLLVQTNVNGKGANISGCGGRPSSDAEIHK